jgi:hypothetical protein
MHREPNSNRLTPSSSSQGSRCSRRLGFRVENIPGAEAVGRWRKRLAGRMCRRSCHSYCRCSRNRCSWSRYSFRCRCSCRNRENRGWDNRGSHGCANRGWSNCANRYSNSWEPVEKSGPVDSLSSGLVDSLNLGLVDRRSLAGRQRGPGWQRRRGLD